MNNEKPQTTAANVENIALAALLAGKIFNAMEDLMLAECDVKIRDLAAAQVMTFIENA